MTSAIPSIALAIALTAALFALEAFWLIRSMARRLTALESIVTMFCRAAIQRNAELEEERARTLEADKRVN